MKKNIFYFILFILFNIFSQDPMETDFPEGSKNVPLLYRRGFYPEEQARAQWEAMRKHQKYMSQPRIRRWQVRQEKQRRREMERRGIAHMQESKHEVDEWLRKQKKIDQRERLKKIHAQALRRKEQERRRYELKQQRKMAPILWEAEQKKRIAIKQKRKIEELRQLPNSFWKTTKLEPNEFIEWYERAQHDVLSARKLARMIFGFAQDSTPLPKDIRKAYRNLTLRFHPDKNSQSQRKAYTKAFKIIGWAYEQLQ